MSLFQSPESEILPHQLVLAKLTAAMSDGWQVPDASSTSNRLCSAQAIVMHYLPNSLQEVQSLLLYNNQNNAMASQDWGRIKITSDDTAFFANLPLKAQEPQPVVHSGFYTFQKQQQQTAEHGDATPLYVDLFLCEQEAPVVSGWIYGQQPMGLNCSGIIVGPYMLQFNKYGLVVPCPIKKNILRFRIAAIDNALLFSTCRTRLAMLIADYNTNYKYGTTVNIKEQTVNSQYFVDAVLKELFAIQIDNQPEIKLLHYPVPKMILDYFEQLKSNEQVPMTFNVGKDFAQNYQIAQATTFTSHEQLDTFVKHLLDQNEQFEMGYPYEYQLLRSYDRAFWFQEADKSSTAILTSKCPFKHKVKK